MMNLKSHAQVYESIGKEYRSRRQPDPRIAKVIRDALGNAKSVCNIGAGAGSYEPQDIPVTAVEPSEVMSSQRGSQSSAPVQLIRAVAENLPFEDDEFDAAMAVLTVHHWEDPGKGLAEMKRISQKQVVYAFDQENHDSLWLLQEYLPEIAKFENSRGLPFQEIVDRLEATEVIPVPVPHDCIDGFQAAYWRRPEMYLEPDVQANISTFAQLPQSVIKRGMAQLRTDLESGAWHSKHADLLAQESRDYGYRLLIAGHAN